MSKSTQRYGQVLLSARLTIESDPRPTKKVLRQQAKLESAAKRDFNKPYSSLTEKEKSDLHLKLREQATERKKNAA